MVHIARNSHRDFLKSQTLLRKRRNRRRARLIAVTFLFLFIIILLAWVSNLDQIKIKKIVVVGNVNMSSEEIENVIATLIDPRYLGIVAKRNAFLYPKDEIVRVLFETYPRIASVDIETESMRILNVRIKERERFVDWCGAVECYEVDDRGYIYAKEKLKENPTEVFVIKGNDQNIGPEPIGKFVLASELFKGIVYSRDALLTIKLQPVEVYVRNRDEIIFTLKNGGKILFSDRRSFEESVENLRSALTSNVLTASSSFEYIDTRFGNKVFYKFKNGATTTSVGKNGASTGNGGTSTNSAIINNN